MGQAQNITLIAANLANLSASVDLRIAQESVRCFIQGELSHFSGTQGVSGCSPDCLGYSCAEPQHLLGLGSSSFSVFSSSKGIVNCFD